MKRFKYIVLMVCIITFSACSSDDDATDNNPCDTTLIVEFEEVF